MSVEREKNSDIAKKWEIMIIKKTLIEENDKLYDSVLSDFTRGIFEQLDNSIDF